MGARPQFIKLAALHHAICNRDSFEHKVIHTQQHYDANMSAVFFEELNMPEPDFTLPPEELNMASSIERMQLGISNILKTTQPEIVLVYGDTNTTLAAARAAKNLQIAIGHIEAGLRSYDSIPEEFNRVETDKISDLLFCPSEVAMKNLYTEGYQHNIFFSGDVMLDAINYYLPVALKKYNHLRHAGFVLATIHRQSTVQSAEVLRNIVMALNTINQTTPVILPAHPRTKQSIQAAGIPIEFELSAPVGYLEMLLLINASGIVMTDSGGVQKEAFFCKKMCVTLRKVTEWKELVTAGVNIIAGTNTEDILNAYEKAKTLLPNFNGKFFGNGKSAESIVETLSKWYENRPDQ